MRLYDQSDNHAGNDLSPIQPTWVLNNLEFELDDIELRWPYSKNASFDFIHARYLAAGISDWSHICQQGFKHLKPGGWLEFQDFEVCFRCDDDTLKSADSLLLWQQIIDRASTRIGRKFDVAETLKQKLLEAGYRDVEDRTYKVFLTRIRSSSLLLL